MHLAQVNIARLRAPIDDPLIADFVAGLDHVNAVADASPGFVWRLQDDSGNATHLEVTADPLVIINISVWETVDALLGFVRSPDHVAFLRRRREWFERWPDGPYGCLWWLPEGDVPTVGEALDRLHHVRDHGSTEHAFLATQVVEPA